MKLTFDRWERNTYDTKVIDEKKFHDIENYIIRLDGMEFTEILLEEDNTSLYICGNGEQYIISFNTGKSNFDLENNENRHTSTKKIELMIRKELNTYSARKVLAIEDALKAAEYYFKFKDKDTSLKWKEIKNKK
ncbi:MULTISPECIES: hypothetical protein [Elizabethkingia]|uniref:Uncharacterized protein n=3 Tax=Elizabethkingia anophelis TaxID=1117645 RepID=A0A455ZJP5_9FLAO|nr:hypothetical protein [Elizabethkingia anophelis]AIL45359.1 hypothetical protein BD94_1584 [Elizabethkingia anophelis NUHP1]MDV4115290.1 hypothetical protein [Elizabethkingia anophelis]DAC76584.1 TPA_exp: hypothetical protein [Elizabethkingia anophelis]